MLDRKIVAGMAEPLWRTVARRILWKVRPRTPLLDSGRRVGPLESRSIRKKVSELGPWFHNMNIAKGIWTHPENDAAGPDYPASRWKIVQPLMPEIRGKACLDVGCSSGFFALKMKELGAQYVLGIDQGEQIRAIEQARFASTTTKLEVDFRTLSVYDVHQLTRPFDLVLFMGVFYHLRHPLLALEAIRKVCSGTLVIQTITTPHDIGTYEPPPEAKRVHSGLRAPELNQSDFPLLRFIESDLDDDTSCWFVPSVEAVLAMLRSSGFKPDQMIRSSTHDVVVRCI